jgi:hypothetical protein
MKLLDATNDNQIGREITRTRQVWQPRLGRELSDDDVRQLMHAFTGFFRILSEWSRAEALGPANDAALAHASKDSKVRDER